MLHKTSIHSIIISIIHSSVPLSLSFSVSLCLSLYLSVCLSLSLSLSFYFFPPPLLRCRAFSCARKVCWHKRNWQLPCFLGRQKNGARYNQHSSWRHQLGSSWIPSWMWQGKVRTCTLELGLVRAELSGMTYRIYYPAFSCQILPGTRHFLAIYCRISGIFLPDIPGYQAFSCRINEYTAT